jgi:precorrin-6x reductase
MHSTRDHRFAYISTADISSWCKATTSFKRPEVKTKRAKTVAVQDLEACKNLILGSKRPHDPSRVVIDAHSGTKGDVAKAVAACEKAIECVDVAMRNANLLNNLFFGRK